LPTWPGRRRREAVFHSGRRDWRWRIWVRVVERGDDWWVPTSEDQSAPNAALRRHRRCVPCRRRARFQNLKREARV